MRTRSVWTSDTTVKMPEDFAGEDRNAALNGGKNADRWALTFCK